MDYPHNGDDGTTGYIGSGRIKKFDLRIETLGAIDEATAILGVVRASSSSSEVKKLLVEIQRDLYKLMAETAADSANVARFRQIDHERVAWLEQQISSLGKSIQIGKDFIIPGDSYSAAMMDLARTIVRRAERRLVELMDRGDVENQQLIRYMNRLSTLLFILEQIENKANGISEITTVKGK